MDYPRMVGSKMGSLVTDEEGAPTEKGRVLVEALNELLPPSLSCECKMNCPHPLPESNSAHRASESDRVREDMAGTIFNGETHSGQMKERVEGPV